MVVLVMQALSVKHSQKRRLLQLYWELREAILNLGVSRPDFEFGELSGKIELILGEIQAPTMLIGFDRLSEIQNALMRMTIMARNWIGLRKA